MDAGGGFAVAVLAVDHGVTLLLRGLFGISVAGIQDLDR
jgi:hypothetical protein